MRLSLGLAATGLVGACSDSPTVSRTPVAGQTPVVTGTGQYTKIAALRCSVRVALRAVSCAPADSSGAARDVIVGGQGQFVTLASSNVSYAANVFMFNATVTNLIPQPMGTADGATPDGTGVRAFFASGPNVTSGTGTISVANADGVSTFTGSNQPYFEYAGVALGADQILSQNETTSAKTWQLNVPATVNTFSFVVYVSTNVPHPKGYVTLSEDTVFVTTGQSHALTASVRSFVGNPVAGAQVTWGTSSTGVATVDGSGNITAVAPGSATITATSDTLVASASVQICPDLSIVGSSYATTDANAASVCVAGGSSTAAEYVAVSSNDATSGSVTFAFTGAGIQAVAGPPTPNRAPAGLRRTLASFGASSGSAADAVSGARFAFERNIQHGVTSLVGVPRAKGAYAADHQRALTGGRSAAGARTHLRWNNPIALASNDVVPGSASRSITRGVVPSVGDTLVLDVAQACLGTPDNRTGVVVSKSAHAIIVADTANPTGGFTTAQYDSIALGFEEVSYDVVATNFATPSDVDSNGGTVLFFTRAVNEFTPHAAANVSFGFFNQKDVHPRNNTTSGCPTSNEGELLYMAVPDPTGVVNSNAVTLATVRANAVPTLTHNLEHLTNVTNRLYNVATIIPEEPWLDEGLADAATELGFYHATGMSTRTNIDATTISGAPGRAEAFADYAAPNFMRLGLWLQRPDTTGAFLHAISTDTMPTGNTAARGALWAFLRYSVDRIGASEPTFWSSLMNTSLHGMANLQNALSADPLLWSHDFATSMYVDDAVAGVPPEYTDPSWNYRSVFSDFGLGGFPLLTQPLTNNVTLSVPTNFGGVSYLRFGIPSAAFGTLRTAVSGGAPPSALTVTIVRTK